VTHLLSLVLIQWRRLQIVPFDHPALATLREACTAPVTKSSPYPNVQALFPDTALLSKEPSERLGKSTDAPAEDAGDLEGELDERAE